MSTETDMRRAVPIETVRVYVEQQLAELEPLYEREQDRGEHGPDWPVICPRYVWIYWLEKKALRRAERAGVGAVLATGIGQTLLEQLGLLGEQLHEQQTEWTDEEGLRHGGDQVSCDLTQDAVQPYWTSQTSISASAVGWRRRTESTERRLWQLNRDLGGATPIPGFEAAHRHAEAAACHFAAYRYLKSSGIAAAAAEADKRRAEAREALEQALAAYQSPAIPRDRIAEELASLARLLSRTGDP